MSVSPGCWSPEGVAMEDWRRSRGSSNQTRWTGSNEDTRWTGKGASHHRHDSHSSSHPHHHPFPYAASSAIADLALLADLVDDREDWCEHLRVSDEQVEEQCKGKTRSVKTQLREFYEKQNYILDGFRQADVVIGSQVSTGFPHGM